MQVKTIMPHGNPWGEEYLKPEGAVYEVPDDQAQVLIDAGLVKAVKAKPSTAAEGGLD